MAPRRLALALTMTCALAAPAVAGAAEPSVPALPCVNSMLLTLSCGDNAAADGPLSGYDSPADGSDASSAPERCRDETLIPASANVARVRRATLCLVNLERTSRDRKPLRIQSTLVRVASSYASKMVRQEFFEHVSPDGSTLTSRVGSTSYLKGSVRRWSIGENLAWGSGRLATPIEIVDSWMGSPGHRRNILDKGFREAGFGIVAGAPTAGVEGDAATYVNLFGVRSRR